jgi:hypothetical protein
MSVKVTVIKLLVLINNSNSNSSNEHISSLSWNVIGKLYIMWWQKATVACSHENTSQYFALQTAVKFVVTLTITSMQIII